MTEILKYCQAAEPNEACGFILADGTFYPCANASESPQEAFSIRGDEWVRCGQDVAAIVHSHPSGESFLSGADRQVQVQSDLPWWLVVGGEIKKFKPVPHLRGRMFKYGKYDCYTILEDAYHLAGIDLMEYERKGLDVEMSDNAFVVNLPKSGFYQVDEPQAGDVILLSMNGQANHAALYIGKNRVIHHAYGFLSRIEEMDNEWLKRTHSYWRHKEWSQSCFTAICADLAHSMTSM